MLPPTPVHPSPILPSNGTVDPDVAALRSRVSSLEARIAALERVLRIHDPDVTLTIPGDLTIEVGGQIDVTCAGSMHLQANLIHSDAPLFRVWGIVDCTTLRTDSVIAATYTPGVGNVW